MIFWLLIFSIETTRLDGLHEQEIAVKATSEINKTATSSDFARCVPRESVPFKGKFSEAAETFLFGENELKDLMACKPDKCAFNFLPFELSRLEGIKTQEGRKNFLKEAYMTRVNFKLGPDPQRTPLFIRYKDKAFHRCGEGSGFQDLLNNRPLRDIPFRLSQAKYNRNMRPTTRLSQGIFWSSKDDICYAEALVFSNHYDIDRIEVWSLRGKELQLELRYRVDLLNSWVRRLNKEKFYKEAEILVDKHMTEAKECLEKK